MFYCFLNETAIIFLIIILITPKLTSYQKILLWGLFMITYSKSILLLYNVIQVVILGNLPVKKKIINNIITSTFKNLFAFSHNFNKLPNKNTIIVSNHPHNPIDYAAFKMLPKKVAIVAGGLQFFVRWTCEKDDYIFYNNNKTKNFDELKTKIQDKIKNMSILVFVENYKRIKYTNNGRKIARLRTGIFTIAKQLNIPITPLVIDRIHSSYGRVTEQPFRMIIGDTFNVTDPTMDAIKTHKFMKLQKSIMESYK